MTRAPHQDEPRIGQADGAIWITRSQAQRLPTTPMLPFERKASRFCKGGAIVLKSHW